MERYRCQEVAENFSLGPPHGLETRHLSRNRLQIRDLTSDTISDRQPLDPIHPPHPIRHHTDRRDQHIPSRHRSQRRQPIASGPPDGSTSDHHWQHQHKTPADTHLPRTRHRREHPTHRAPRHEHTNRRDQRHTTARHRRRPFARPGRGTSRDPRGVNHPAGDPSDRNRNRSCGHADNCTVTPPRPW